MPIFLLVNFVDISQAYITGVIRGVGKEDYASVCFISLYPILGLTVAYICAFSLDGEIKGIYFGQGLGLGLYFLTQLYPLFNENWEDLSDKIRHRISNDDRINDILIVQETTTDVELIQI